MKEYIMAVLDELILQRTVNYAPADYPGRGPDGMVSPGEEHKVAAIILREFAKCGVQHVTCNADAGRPDVFGFIGRGEPGYRKLLIAAHMDTVPSGSGWSVTEPFLPKVQDGRLYGRGAEDNKGQLAALCALAQLLKAKEQDIKGQVILAGVSDEEVGMCPGLVQAIRSGKVTPTDAIIPDVGGSMKKITVAEKGRLLVEVTAQGKAAHASRPHLGSNAITALAQFLSALGSYQLHHEPTPLFPDGPTVNVGLVRGGLAPNQVPARCTATLDIRYLPTQKPQAIIAELQALAAGVHGASFAFTIRDDHTPMAVPEDVVVITAIRKHADVKLVGIGGGTVSKVMTELGIPSVGFSPGDEDAAHVADEWISLDELARFAELMVKIAMDVVNAPA